MMLEILSLQFYWCICQCFVYPVLTDVMAGFSIYLHGFSSVSRNDWSRSWRSNFMTYFLKLTSIMWANSRSCSSLLDFLLKSKFVMRAPAFRSRVHPWATVLRHFIWLIKLFFYDSLNNYLLDLCISANIISQSKQFISFEVLLLLRLFRQPLIHPHSSVKLYFRCFSFCKGSYLWSWVNLRFQKYSHCFLSPFWIQETYLSLLWELDIFILLHGQSYNLIGVLGSIWYQYSSWLIQREHHLSDLGG